MKTAIMTLAVLGLLLAVTGTATAAPRLAVGPTDCDDPNTCICINPDAQCGEGNNAYAAVYLKYNSGPVNATVCFDTTGNICTFYLPLITNTR